MISIGTSGEYFVETLLKPYENDHKLTWKNTPLSIYKLMCKPNIFTLEN